MLRSSLSNDEQELVRSAQANVGLVADDIWASCSADNRESYRRLNRRLWIRSCKIAENYGKLGSATRSQRRVRDVIPESRLATYGDFEYEDEAELIRAVLHPDVDDDNDDNDNEDEEKPKNGSQSNDDKEPWMLDQVEEYLARIADAGRRRRSTREQVTKRDETLSDSHKSSNQTASVREDRDKTPPLTMREIDEATTTSAAAAPPRFSVTNVSEAQLEGRIFNEAVRNLWRSPSPHPTTLTAQLHRGLRNELQRELGLLRPQSRANNDVQQTHSNFQTERLRMPSRTHYSYMQMLNVMHQQRPALCVEVPEFFPNNNKNAPWPVAAATTSEDHAKYTENPYQDDMYTYKAHVQTSNSSRKTVALYQNTLVPMVPTPIVSAMVWPSQTWAQRILPPPIPIHQMPTPPPIPIPQPAPAPMCPTVVHRPIRLPESTANKHPTTSHKHIPVYQRTAKVSQEYPQRRKSQGVDFNNLILLTKSAMKVRKTQAKPARKSFAESARMSHVKSDATTTRWLDKGYQKREREFVTVTTSHPKNPNQDNSRAVISSSTSNDDDEDEEASMDNFPASRKQLYDDEMPNFEKSYDELERQAMEQYRTSEECLALRYQELEQQALEQYKTAESTESINESGRTDRRNDEEEKVDNVNDNGAGNDDDVDDGETRDCCSSGFGKCNSPDLVDDEKEKKAEEPEQQPARIRILRAEVQRAASEGSLRRPIAVARRLPQSRSQKNTDRGASDDNTVKASSSLSSLKRRLMPMSPLERTKSGGCPTTMRNLDPVKAAVQTLDKHVAAYYRNNNVSQTGSGDAKVNGTAVWLSDFWS